MVTPHIVSGQKRGKREEGKVGECAISEKDAFFNNGWGGKKKREKGEYSFHPVFFKRPRGRGGKRVVGNKSLTMEEILH